MGLGELARKRLHRIMAFVSTGGNPKQVSSPAPCLEAIECVVWWACSMVLVGSSGKGFESPSQKWRMGNGRSNRPKPTTERIPKLGTKVPILGIYRARIKQGGMMDSQSAGFSPNLTDEQIAANLAANSVARLYTVDGWRPNWMAADPFANKPANLHDDGTGRYVWNPLK